MMTLIGLSNMQFTLMVLALTCVTALADPGREVAITIDDLPRGGDNHSATELETRQMTERLLAPLHTGQIPFIGFVNECHRTSELRSLLPLWKAAGADLGNHTCSHVDLHAVSPEVFETEVVQGEVITTELLGHRPKWFRHPFLHTGKDAATKARIVSFLASRGYRIAPVTLDDSDWMFAAAYSLAQRRNDAALAKRVRDAYIPYMESIFDFFEKRSVEVTGHEVRQVLLIHASQLNADAMPDLLAMMKRRGYTFVTLDRALEDEAYALPETYAGRGGFSWIHRWSITKGVPAKGEPDEPAWINQLSKEPR